MRKKVKLGTLNKGDEFYLDRSGDAVSVVHGVADKGGLNLYSGYVAFVQDNDNYVRSYSIDLNVWVETETVTLGDLEPGDTFEFDYAAGEWIVCENFHYTIRDSVIARKGNIVGEFEDSLMVFRT